MEVRTLLLAAAVAVPGVAVNGQPSMTGGQERVAYFSGTVTMEDGSPPPDAVLLQRVCSGAAHNEGWTDTKGRFSFSVGRKDSESESGDAAEETGRPTDVQKPIGYSMDVSNPLTAELRDCELAAVLSGYRTDRVSLKVTGGDAVGLGTIVLHPVSKLSVLTISATTLGAPANAKKAYEKGLEAAHVKKWDAAISSFRKATDIYPKYAMAWYQLGDAYLSRSDPTNAVDAWQRASQADPKYVKPLEKLTLWADQKQDWTAEEKYSDAWLRLDPDDFPGAWLLNAIAKARLGQTEDAEHAAREGLRVDKEQRVPRLSYVLGLLLGAKHQFVESAECFRTYLKLAPNARDAEAVRQQLAEYDRMATSGQRN
jgi:tetratricopeptide (TPR) repeat protein